MSSQKGDAGDRPTSSSNYAHPSYYLYKDGVIQAKSITGLPFLIQKTLLRAEINVNLEELLALLLPIPVGAVNATTSVIWILDKWVFCVAFEEAVGKLQLSPIMATLSAYKQSTLSKDIDDVE